VKPAGVKFYVQLHNDNDAGSHAFGVGGKAIGATEACRHHEHVSVATMTNAWHATNPTDSVFYFQNNTNPITAAVYPF